MIESATSPSLVDAGGELKSHYPSPLYRSASETDLTSFKWKYRIILALLNGDPKGFSLCQQKGNGWEKSGISNNI